MHIAARKMTSIACGIERVGACSGASSLDRDVHLLQWNLTNQSAARPMKILPGIKSGLPRNSSLESAYRSHLARLERTCGKSRQETPKTITAERRSLLLPPMPCIACVILVTLTATLRLLDGSVAIDHGTRRRLHMNVATHPAAAWTRRQWRETIGFGDSYRYLLHDRESCFAACLAGSIKARRHATCTAKAIFPCVIWIAQIVVAILIPLVLGADSRHRGLQTE